MPNTCKNEEYVDMHFVYGLCSRNCMAAAVEYQHSWPHGRIPPLKTSETVPRMLRETGYLPLANTENEQQRLGQGDVLAAVR